MIVYGLKEAGQRLREKLQSNSTPETARMIAFTIESAIRPDATPLTQKEKLHLVNYVKYPVYDHKTGQAAPDETEDPAFLELIAVILNIVNANDLDQPTTSL